MGKSGMDSLPYDLTENDNADQGDAVGSQENNSFEKSDADDFTVPFARIGAAGGSTNVPVTSVAVSGSGVSSGKLALNTGDTSTLSATVSPSNATDASVSWSSSDSSVASVDSSGKVTGVKAGTATVTASAGGKSASVAVTVTDTSTDSTVYYPSSVYGATSTYLHYRVGSGAWTTAPGVKMSAACDGWVKYTIPDTDGQTVEFVFNNGSGTWDNNSKANYKGSGSSIVVKSGVVSSTAPCAVAVTSVAVSGSGVSSGKLSLAKGASSSLTATVSPSDATDQVVSWSSSDSSVASVTGTGKVTGVKAGTATVTAEAGGKSASVVVTVTDSSSSSTVSFTASASVADGEKLYVVGDWGQSNPWSRSSGVLLSGSGSTYTGSVSVASGTSMKFRLVKVTSAGKLVWDSQSDRVVSSVSGGVSLGVSWDSSEVTKDGSIPESGLTITGDGVSSGAVSVSKGSTLQLGTSLSSSDGSVVTWWSDGSHVAVTGTGNVVGLSAGTDTVTVTVNGKKATVKVTVK
jgi:alpha-amylase